MTPEQLLQLTFNEITDETVATLSGLRFPLRERQCPRCNPAHGGDTDENGVPIIPDVILVGPVDDEGNHVTERRPRIRFKCTGCEEIVFTTRSLTAMRVVLGIETLK